MALGESYISAIYALLPDKTKSTYEEMLQAVTDKCTDLGLNIAIQTVVTDFEDAAMKAVTSIFGRHVSTKGCFFI